MDNKRRSVINHLKVIHTWAAYQIQNGEPVFDQKACEDVVKWTDEALEVIQNDQPAEKDTLAKGW